LRDLVESDLLTKNKMGYWLPPGGSVPVPTLLQQVISQRLKRLGVEAGTFLEVAAIVGETWDLEIVEAVLNWPEDDLLSQLEEALAARILKTTDSHSERYQFAHGLIQEVLYDRQLARRRKGRHGKILQLLEGRGADAAMASQTKNIEAINALAYHSRMAEQWEKAYTYNVKAGDAARDRFAMHSTVRFYQQAVDAAQQVPDGVTLSELLLLYEQLGEAFTALNNMQEAESAFADMAAAAQQTDDGSAEGRALSKLAVSRDSLYQPQKALGTHQKALSVAEKTGGRRLLALVHFNIGHHYLVYGDLSRCREHLGQAESFARAANEPKILADSLRNLGILDTFSGRYAQAEPRRMEALGLVQTGRHQIGLTSLQWGIGFGYIEQGKYEQAQEAIQVGLDNIENLREVHYYLVKLLNLMGYLYSELGDFATALKWDLKALETSQRDEASRNNESHCYTLLNVATDYLHAGRLTEAIETVQRFEAEDEKIEYSRFRYLNRYYLLLAELALARGKFEKCLEHVGKAEEMAHKRGIPKNIVKCLLFEGQALLGLNQYEEASERLGEAVELADEIGHASLRWKTRLRLAEAYTLLEKPRAKTYQQAVDLVDEIATGLQDLALREPFLRSPLVVELKANARLALKEPEKTEPPPKVEKYPAGLTERELEVLRLIARGDTNRQIAETLFISVRTVSTHVTHILTKTNCDNRAAAATFAARHDLV
jgi:DNA-binding CsgD family transcriptional regulator